MRSWRPNPEELRYVDLIYGMSRDSILGCGVVDRETFVANLRSASNLLEKLPKAGVATGTEGKEG